MDYHKKIVLACSLEEESTRNLENVKNYFFSREAAFHFVHIFKIQLMINEFTPYVYPDEGQRGTIEEYVLKGLSAIKKKIYPGHQRTQEVCLFDTNPKGKMVEYLEEVQADLVVVASRGKHGMEGLFTSSFTDYLLKFSRCDVLVLRPQKEEGKLEIIGDADGKGHSIEANRGLKIY